MSKSAEATTATVVKKATAPLTEEELETMVAVWLLKKTEIRRLQSALEAEKEALATLERENPFLGNVKGMIRKASSAAEISKTPKEKHPETTTPTETPPTTPTAAGKSTKRRLEEKMKKISQKSAKFKNDQTFKGTSHSAPPEEVTPEPSRMDQEAV
jgi:hypothetical protein